MFPSIWTPPAPPKPLPYPALAMPAATISRRGIMRKSNAIITPGEIDPDNLLLSCLPDFATIFEDIGGTTLAADENDPVGNWSGSDPVTNDLVAEQNDRRPILKLNIVNGYPGIQFGASDVISLRYNGLSSNFSGEDLPITIAACFKKNGNSGSDALLGIGYNVAAGGYLIGTYNTDYYRLFKSDGATTCNATGGTPDSNAHWLVLRSDGVNVHAWIDGDLIIDNVACNVGSVPCNTLGIGNFAGTSYTQGFDGTITEFNLWKSAIDDDGCSELNTYGVIKYAL